MRHHLLRTLSIAGRSCATGRRQCPAASDAPTDNSRSSRSGRSGRRGKSGKEEPSSHAPSAPQPVPHDGSSMARSRCPRAGRERYRAGQFSRQDAADDALITVAYTFKLPHRPISACDLSGIEGPARRSGVQRGCRGRSCRSPSTCTPCRINLRPACHRPGTIATRSRTIGCCCIADGPGSWSESLPDENVIERNRGMS